MRNIGEGEEDGKGREGNIGMRNEERNERKRRKIDGKGKEE